MRLLAAAATLILAVGFATGASAHAALVSAEPADGSVLAAAPGSVELRFNESVTPGAIRLIDAEGRERTDARIDASGQTIRIAVPGDLPHGTQMLSYRVVSQDGHPVGGSLTFSIGAVTGAVAPADDRLLPILIWLTRIGLYIGLFAGVGGVFFVAWIGRRPSGGTAVMAALYVGLISAVAALGLQGLDLLNLPIAGAATFAPWRAALSTSLGPSLLVAIAAMVVARLGWQSVPVESARIRAALAMLGVGLALAVSGHAASASPQWLTRPLLFVHGFGAAFWIGALAPLTAMAWQRELSLAPVLKIFSSAAVPVVAVLTLAGLVLAVIQVEHFGALVETSYGIVLLTKLALVIGLLALAALNRFRFTPMVMRDGRNTRPLARSTLLECTLALAVLAVVAGWRFTPPPRTIVPATPLAVHMHSDKAMFQVLVSPGRAGSDDFVLQLMTGEAAPLDAKEVTLTLSLPERGVEPAEHGAERGADGYWHVHKLALPFAGRWHMRVDALVSDFEKITLEDELDLAAR